MYQDSNAVRGYFTTVPSIAFFIFFTASYDALGDKTTGQGHHKFNIFKHR